MITSEIPLTYQYLLLTRAEIYLPEIGPKELLAINEDARRQIETFLIRLNLTNEEIQRRDAAGDLMENEDYDYQIVPDSHSPTETSVLVTWKPGRFQESMKNFNQAQKIAADENRELYTMGTDEDDES